MKPEASSPRCAYCGHARSLHPNDVDCAADDGFDNCGCAEFIHDVPVSVPLSVLYRIHGGILEATGCRKAKANGCDCRVGGMDALAQVQRLLGRNDEA